MIETQGKGEMRSKVKKGQGPRRRSDGVRIETKKRQMVNGRPSLSCSFVEQSNEWYDE